MAKFMCPLIAVKDINVARKFYEALFGMNVVTDYGANIVFDSGLALQAKFDWLTGVPPESIQWKPNDFELYFETEDLDAFAEQLKNHPEAQLLHPAKEYDWGQRVLRFYDPDGHLIEVGEPMEAAVRRFLDAGMNVEETMERTMQTEEFVRSCMK